MDKNGIPLRGEMSSLLEGKEKYGPFTREILFRAAYETDFGLLDHNDPRNQKPMALVKHLPKEDEFSYGPMARAIQRFITYKIADYTNMDIVSFFQMPRCYVDMVFAAAAQEIATNAKEAERIRKALESQQNATGAQQ